MTEPSRAELKYLVERQRETIRSMNDVRKLLTSTVEPVELIQAVAAYLKHSFPIALCAVLLIEQRRLLVFPFAPIAQVDLDGALHTLLAAAGERSALPRAASALERVIFPVPGGTGGAAMRAGYLRGHHAAALLSGTQLVGMLGMFSANADAFTAEDRHVIDSIADQLRATLRLAFLLESLRRADRLKADLLAIISHELRIPLTAITEGVGLVREGSLGAVTAEQQEFLDTVQENAERLSALVGKVVLATQVLTGHLTLKPAPAALAALFVRLQQQAQPLADQRGVQLIVEPVSASLSWPVDAERLHQALAQLVDNAVHATPQEGAVRLTAQAAPEGLVVRVSDQGSGIPAERLPHLFEQFSSLGSIDDRKTGGLGLGLFLAKSLINAHGGTLTVESAVGRGTTAIVTLPKPAKIGDSH